MRAALEDGYVIGGGLALLNASRDLDLSGCTHFEKTGFEIIQKACEEPAKQIITNAMGDLSKAVSILEKYFTQASPNLGFNSRTKRMENLLE